MDTRFKFVAPRFWIFGLTLLLAAAPIQAEPIRVTTWDFQPKASAGTNDRSNKSRHGLIQEASDLLKELRPDVIILQHVADWETCHQLAQALQPATYEVVICSSFRDGRANLLGQQVAILSKTKAYLAWSEPWQNNGESPPAPGGFAFAALQLDHKNVALFSVQFGLAGSSGTAESRNAASQEAREESARQFVQQFNSLQNWNTNRPQAFIVAGDFDTTLDDARLAHEKTLSLLEQAGFENAFAGLPLEQQVTRPVATLDYIFTRDAGRVSPPLMKRSSLIEHDAVTCEIDLATPKPMTAPPPPSAVATAAVPAHRHKTTWWLAGFLAGSLALFVLVRKFGRQPRLQPASATLLDLKPKTGVSIAAPRADQTSVSHQSGSSSYVQISVEDSTQTQWQAYSPSEIQGATARMPEAVRAGVVANLSRWLKQRLVQRLVSERSQLLATQQAATLKLLSVDKRLSKLEEQIQQRNQDYEQRIDELQKELVTAKEENRELIRAKIALIKVEIEKARLQAERQT